MVYAVSLRRKQAKDQCPPGPDVTRQMPKFSLCHGGSPTRRCRSRNLPRALPLQRTRSARTAVDKSIISGRTEVLNEQSDKYVSGLMTQKVNLSWHATCVILGSSCTRAMVPEQA